MIKQALPLTFCPKLTRKNTSESIHERSTSGSGSNQPEALSIQHPSCDTSTPLPATSNPTHKRKASTGKANGGKKKAIAKSRKQELVLPHSPAMCTRSKTGDSPAKSTRSKRKLLRIDVQVI
ncbi:hypothetical protein BS78_08G102800 [Paspalum vaginatum]|nr:hypothetical protein BS78_08G102800 [Paspalum vaginatum]